MYSLSKKTAFASSTFIETKSFTPLGGGPTAAGKLTRIPFMWVWLKLTIMKLASRKNMMSINGMISMRARLCGIGEATCIKSVGRARHRVCNWDFDSRGNLTRLKSPASECAGGRVVQNRTADGLRHRRVRHRAAGGVNAEHGNTATGNMTAAR